MKSHKAVLKKQDEFIPNEETENIKEELIMLKLKGYINQRDITGKSTEIRKLPNKVQVGTMIEGDPILKTKIRSTKKHSSVIDYFLELDQ